MQQDPRAGQDVPTEQNPIGGPGGQPSWGSAPPQPGWQQAPAQPSWGQPQPPQQGWQQPPTQPGWGQPQPGWQQQPAQPGWGQPAQSGWGTPPPIVAYGSSPAALIAGLILVVLGVLAVLGGVLVVVGGQAANSFLGGGFAGVFTAIGIVITVIGVLEVLAAIGIFTHRTWGRVLGFIFAVLGTLLGIASLASAGGPRTTTTIGTQVVTTGDTLTSALFILVPYALALLGLILGGSHFRQRAR